MNQNMTLADQAQNTRENSVGWKIQQISGRLGREMTRELADEGLKLDHFVVLMRLAEFENITQTQLGDGISMPNYAITRALDHLEARDLVERRPDVTSRRAHRVFLTEKGRALMPELFKVVQRVNAKLLAPLPKEIQSQLIAALDVLL